MLYTLGNSHFIMRVEVTQTLPMDDSLNIECITTPRFMEAMDFLKTIDDEMVKICICGKKFNTNFGDYDTCHQCEKNIENEISKREYEEQFGIEAQ